MENNDPLSEKEKKLLALALFSLAMHHGPKIFGELTQIAEKLGVEQELVFYAADWVKHGDKNKAQDS